MSRKSAEESILGVLWHCSARVGPGKSFSGKIAPYAGAPPPAGGNSREFQNWALGVREEELEKVGRILRQNGISTKLPMKESGPPASTNGARTNSGKPCAGNNIQKICGKNNRILRNDNVQIASDKMAIEVRRSIVKLMAEASCPIFAGMVTGLINLTLLLDEINGIESSIEIGGACDHACSKVGAESGRPSSNRR